MSKLPTQEDTAALRHALRALFAAELDVPLAAVTVAFAVLPLEHDAGQCVTELAVLVNGKELTPSQLEVVTRSVKEIGLMNSPVVVSKGTAS